MLERFVTLTPVAIAYRALAVRLFDFAVGPMQLPRNPHAPRLEADHQSTNDRGITTLTSSPGTFAASSTSHRMNTLPRA